ncbi:AAA family ATPase [Paenibacillus sp. SGZ-1009]|uniref:AAA family ATPase n=1 Tax=Paenibacillus campi TaxID=3106031 RepID=UPI002AFF2F83|nr:AAA family ATPase [Paenibacillus sp. SGZ-1009]
MRIHSISITDFRAIHQTKFNLHGDSALLIGLNGAGKSSVLECLSILFSYMSASLTNRRINASRKHMSDKDIRKKASSFTANLIIEFENNYYSWMIGQTINKKEKSKSLFHNKELKHLTDFILTQVHQHDNAYNIPLAVYYPTHRAVLDIPLRIRNKHEFDPFSAWEGALKSGVDFRVFFEWFRNREDLENEVRLSEDIHYRDIQLEAVRNAIYSFLHGFSHLRVKRNPLKMVISKKNQEFEVDMLSDGEKCMLAMAGDLARRLAIANPQRVNPLTGEGIVLIDEVELHLHPQWQREIIAAFKTTFPNIQFIFTTHSPQVLGEANGLKTYLLEASEEGTKSKDLHYVYGKDSNRILEEDMGASERNKDIQQDLDLLDESLSRKDMNKASILVASIKEKLGSDTPELIRANVLLDRWRSKNEANF